MLITSTIIGFDLDGVIINHVEMKRRLAKQFGFTITPAETNSETMSKIIPKETWLKIQNLLYDHPAYCLESPLALGAIETLERLKQEKKIFSLISLRKKPDAAIDILKYHKLWPKYFNQDNTFFVHNREDKNTEAYRLGVTHYIDDEVRVLEKLNDVPNKFLFDPFCANQSSEYKTVASWVELRQFLF